MTAVSSGEQFEIAGSPTAPIMFAALRVGYAALLLAAPGPVIRLCAGSHADRPARTVARLLGARHLMRLRPLG